MIFHRNSIWLLPLLAIITFPVWSGPLGDFLAPRGGFDPLPPEGSSTSHNFNMEKIKVLQNQEGRDTARIVAANARTDEDPEILKLEEVDAEIYDDEGRITHIVAGQGNYHTSNRLLTLMDDVVVHKVHDRQTLYTDLLLYHGQWRTVRCPERVKITGDKVEIIGGSLDYDIATQTYEIGEGVHCVLQGFVNP
jgi:LPS export ABC transporter protein LptC